MPIIGLTKENPNTLEGLPRLGKLRKGAPKKGNRPGEDLDHFRFTPEAEFESTLDGVFEYLYGNEPRGFDNIWLASNDIANEVFPTWMEWWSQNETLRIRTDGAIVYREYVENKQRYEDTMRPIRESELENCKEVGRFNIIMPELIQATGIFGLVTAETHSKHDIVTLHNYLTTINSIYGKLIGLRFVFGRVEKEISIPGSKGRFMGTKSLFSLRVAPEDTIGKLLPAVHQTMIEAPTAPQIAPPPMAEFKQLIGGEGSHVVYKPVNPDESGRKRRKLDTSGVYGGVAGSSALNPAENNEPEDTDNKTEQLELTTALVSKVVTTSHRNTVKHTLHSKKGEITTVFTRKLFRDAGWVSGDDWTEKTTHELETPIPVNVAQKGNGWELHSVEPKPKPEPIQIEDVIEAESEEAPEYSLMADVFEYAKMQLGMTNAETIKWMKGGKDADAEPTVEAWVDMVFAGDIEKARAHIDETAAARESEAGKA